MNAGVVVVKSAIETQGGEAYARVTGNMRASVLDALDGMDIMVRFGSEQVAKGEDRCATCGEKRSEAADVTLHLFVPARVPSWFDNHARFTFGAGREFVIPALQLSAPKVTP